MCPDVPRTLNCFSYRYCLGLTAVLFFHVGESEGGVEFQRIAKTKNRLHTFAFAREANVGGKKRVALSLSTDTHTRACQATPRSNPI